MELGPIDAVGRPAALKDALDLARRQLELGQEAGGRRRGDEIPKVFLCVGRNEDHARARDCGLRFQPPYDIEAALLTQIDVNEGYLGPELLRQQNASALVVGSRYIATGRLAASYGRL